MTALALIATTFTGFNELKAFGVNANLEPYKVDLVKELEGKTIENGVVSFERNSYQFTFLVSGVSFSNGQLVITQGGYIKNATAYNGLENILLEGTYSNGLLSTGTLTSSELARTSDKEVPLATNDVTLGDTHFKLEADKGDVTLAKLELEYRCGNEVITTSSTEWDLSWDFLQKGTEEDPILISSLADWNKFAEYTKTNKFDGKYVALTENIEATEENSLTLACDSDNSNIQGVSFNGTFDGRGHTITYNATATIGRKGLFCRTGNATIKNLIVDGSFNGVDVIGGVVGENIGTTQILNVTSSVDISNTNTGMCTSSAGILGLHVAETANDLLLIDGCEFNGSFIGSNYESAGGIVGNVNRANANLTIRNSINKAALHSESHGLGGIVGRVNAGPKLILENCVNDTTASIKTDADCVAGIIGKALTTTTITNCVNKAAIEDTTNGISSTGGIVGYTENNTYTYTINNCTNYGAVTGWRFVGGVIGRNETIKGNVRVNNSINHGKILSKGSTAKNGGIIGGSASGTATNNTIIDGCINFGEINSSTQTYNGLLVGGLVGSFGTYGQLINSINYGNVVSNGGVVAGIAGESLANSSITNCVNYGDVTANDQRTAGIVGAIVDGVRVTYNTNFGNITGKGYANGGVGGIAGIYFPKVSNNVKASCDNNVNYGNIHSTNIYAGGIVGVFGDASCVSNISNCTNYGAVSSTTNKHGGIVGSNDPKGTAYKVDLINCYSYGTVSGATSNVSTNSTAGNIISFKEGIYTGSAASLDVALEPNTWTLGANESYAAILSDGTNSKTVTLEKDGSVCTTTADILTYRTIEFVILDSNSSVKETTGQLQLGAGQVYSITDTTTGVTGTWKQLTSNITIKVDTSNWIAADTLYAELVGYNLTSLVEMTYNEELGYYTLTVDASNYHQVRFLTLDNGETANAQNATEVTSYIGLSKFGTLTYNRLGVKDNTVYGSWSN